MAIETEWNKATSGVHQLPGWGRAISFDHIIATGNIPSLGWINNMVSRERNLTVNFAANDAYTTAIRRIVEDVKRDIENNRPDIQELLSKRDWSRDDRRVWETYLSAGVVERMRAIPGMDTYRTEGRHPVRRSSSLNDLSMDIGNAGRPPTLEFDCEHMSATVGIAMQQIENHCLSGVSSGLRAPHSYHYVTGMAYNFPDGKRRDGEGHATIMSSATGNIIEATTISGNWWNHPYYNVNIRNYSFEQFLRTGLTQTREGVFSSQNITDEVAQSLNERFQREDWELRQEGYARERQGTKAVTVEI